MCERCAQTLLNVFGDQKRQRCSLGAGGITFLPRVITVSSCPRRGVRGDEPETYTEETRSGLSCCVGQFFQGGCLFPEAGIVLGSPVTGKWRYRQRRVCIWDGAGIQWGGGGGPRGAACTGGQQPPVCLGLPRARTKAEQPWVRWAGGQGLGVLTDPGRVESDGCFKRRSDITKCFEETVRLRVENERLWE